ncbi:glycosyltransferase [Methylobacterium sp. D54C]
MKSAAVTIVSRNYLSSARVLARTFKQSHPEVDFFVYICDSKEGVAATDDFRIIGLDEVAIPNASYFFSQYNVMEANTAVKPFVLEYLLQDRGYDKVAYLDPDIQIFQPMDEVWSALDESFIVLTPHLRRPFQDDRTPTELQILQSGTYNLGFVALSRGHEATRFVRWWQDRLYRECIVDIPRGLFVDQKWVDLIPGYFRNVHILHSPTYNVAYWNLHEREIILRDGTYYIEGRPLVFFHFSGYSPFQPDQLSKHQNRHDLSETKVVKMICDDYGSLLIEAGFIEQSRTPYAYSKLNNGISLSWIVQRIVRKALDEGNIPPDPWTSDDAFADWLMTSRVYPDGQRFTPLQRELLEARTDVANAFPAVHRDFRDNAFWNWVRKSGRSEMNIGTILDRCSEVLDPPNLVAELFSVINRRADVISFYKDFWFDDSVFEELCGWIVEYGMEEEGLSLDHASALRTAKDGISRIIRLYLRRTDLQSALGTIGDSDGLSRYVDWLQRNAITNNVTSDEIELFRQFAIQNPEYIARICALYRIIGKDPQNATPNAWSVASSRSNTSSSELVALQNWLLAGGIHPGEQLRAYLTTRLARGFRAPLAHEEVKTCLSAFRSQAYKFMNESEIRAFYLLTQKALPDLDIKSSSTVNVAGHFDAPTGMGVSGNSMLVTIAASRWSYESLTLPTIHDEGLPSKRDRPLGWASKDAQLSITVANADTTAFVKRFVPASFSGQKKIGYWVWEVDKAPENFRAASREYDYIWTPSSHSADAIRAVVDVPVRVLPHVIDITSLSHYKSNRDLFSIPKGVTSFYFAFDAKSVLYRKNPGAALNAFRRAFGARSDVHLIIKVTGAEVMNLDYQRFKSDAARYQNVSIIEGTFTREKSFTLLASTDVYISLHRAEGFGLTCAEAMAMQKPVVASSYSGNMDYMEGYPGLVSGEITTSQEKYGPYSAGCSWFEADIDQAASIMTSFLDTKVRRNAVKLGMDLVRDKLSPAVVASQFEALMDEALAN